MAAAPGIVTASSPPNAAVEIQPGMQVQPVVLVDENGQYVTGVTPSGSAGGDLGGTYPNPTVTATHLASPQSLAQGGTAQNAASNAALLTALGAAALAGAAFAGEVTVQTPVNPSDAVTKAYADAIAQGLSVKPSVQEATAAALPANTYSNGASGVGATLTAVLAGVLTVDGIAVALGDRVLVQNEAAPANNGIYTVTTLGTVGVAYILTRAADMNTAASVPGAFAFTERGTANTGAGFTVASGGPFTIGTTAVTWTQFSGAGEIVNGTNLAKSGNTISLATSPALSGTPTSPTGTAGDNSTQIATDAFVQSALAATAWPNQCGYGTWTWDWYSDVLVIIPYNNAIVASGNMVLTRMLYLPAALTLTGNVDVAWKAGTGGGANTYAGVYLLSGGNATLQGSGSADLSAQASAMITVATGQTSWAAGWYALGYLAGTQSTSGNAGAPYAVDSGNESGAGFYLPGDTFAPVYASSYYAGSYSALPSSVALSHFTTRSYMRMHGALR